MTSKPPKLPVLDVSNPTEALKSLRQRQHLITDGLIELGLEYANKVTGQFISAQSERYFSLRNSIYYRLEGMLFHLDLLLAVQSNHQKRFADNPFDQQASMELLDGGTAQQLQVFDSIIFHAIALFDYLGNLVDYMCGSKHQMRLKWNGVVKAIRDETNPMSASPIAPVVLTLHSTLVDALYGHRSELIHYQSDDATAMTSIRLMTSEAEFSVFAPKRLCTRFPELSTLSTTHRPTLRYVAFWTCEKTIEAAASMIEPLMRDLEVNRRTPSGFAIFLKGPPS